MLQPVLHYSLHFILPVLIGVLFFGDQWKRVSLLLLLTMLIDLDHLMATPIFDPGRCSVGFHPLHNYVAIGLYFLVFYRKETRILGLGFLLHIATDYLDCLWMK